MAHEVSPAWTVTPLDEANATAELDAIIAIEATCFTNPWTRQMYEEALGDGSVSRFMLARSAGDRIIGFCSYWQVVDEVHINNLAVLPEFRRQGIGRALLRRILADAVRQGATRALLEVRRSNDEARRLYESLGFTVAGVRRQYYSHPTEDALVLWREYLDHPVRGVLGPGGRS